MATKKKKRKSPSVHTQVRRKKGTKRRRAKRGLSEIFTPGSFKESGKSSLFGLVGGAGSYLIDKIIPVNTNEGIRLLVQGGASVILGGALGFPKLGAGIAGGYGYGLMTRLEKGLSEDEMEENDFADEDVLDEYPDALDEEGTPMYLADDGEFYYMEEFELADESEFNLSQGMFRDAQMYPEYVNASSY